MTMLAGAPDPATLQARWKWFVVFGFIFVALGVVALGNIVDATIFTTVFIGFMLVFGGIAQVVASFMSGSTAGTRILEFVLGILYVIVGANIVADPLKGAIALTIVIAVMLFVSGIIRIVSSLMNRTGGWVLGVVVGVVDVLLGLWIWTGIPVSGVVIGFFVGIELLMAGFLWIALGFGARSMPAGPAPAAA